MDVCLAIRDFLHAHHVMTLATSGTQGPAAAAVFYVNEGASFYFLSSPRSLHAVNLAGDPRLAATIQDDQKDWASIRGLQLTGNAHEVDGDERALAEQLYSRKFPGVLDGAGVPLAMAQALQRIRWYRFQVCTLRFIDNSRGFGHRDELDATGLDCLS